MKNYDLIWAREWAGLTQAQAAEKMGVHRVTFAHWETGARPIPTRKWRLFLKRVAVNPQDIPKCPKPMQYDADGYPIGFDRKMYEVMAMDISGFTMDDGSAGYDDVFGWDLEEAALMGIEGDDYESRSRERAGLNAEGIYSKTYKNKLPDRVRVEQAAARARAEWQRWELTIEKELLEKTASQWRRWESSGSNEALENARAMWRKSRLADMPAAIADEDMA
jgi:DNA-binding XRE family transcriptional regulator